jgi:hypothetical protein
MANIPALYLSPKFETQIRRSSQFPSVSAGKYRYSIGLLNPQLSGKVLPTKTLEMRKRL